MFNFTTTNVINTAKDSSGIDRYMKTDNGDLFVARVGTFKKENIKAAYKAVPVEPENASAVIDFSKISGVENNTVLRLTLYIGLSQASQDAIYANDLYFKGKPFTIEFLWKGEDDTAAALEKIINRHNLFVYGERMLNVKASGTTLTIDAVNEYQRFRMINIDKFDATLHNNIGDFVNIATMGDDVINIAKEGKEGFGTYSFILHNLRIPTTAHTNFGTPKQDEMPVLGGMYTQYTIEYCVNRGTLGLNAVGDQVTSVTTHVFYVLDGCGANDASSTTFETALTGVLAGTDVTLQTVPGEDPEEDPEEEGD